MTGRNWILIVLAGMTVLLVMGSNNQTPAQQLAATTGSEAQDFLTPQQELGENLFFDKDLSNPPCQSCASCHNPSRGFEDSEDRDESAGAVKGRAGNRNAPTAAYAAYSPYFNYSVADSSYVGGQFWDGRAANLMKQAEGPFLNPLEMDNPDKQTVIEKIRKAKYAQMFEDVYGPGSLDNVDAAFDLAAEAIAAFEQTPEFHLFNSRFDDYLAGKASLSEQELRGLRLFEDEKKGNCASCHPSKSAADGLPPLFTDHTYDNLGVPRNPDNPFYKMPKKYNPDGEKYVDLGLGGVLKKP